MKSDNTPVRDDNTAGKAGDTSMSGQAKHDIPKFDLAQQILAGQRKFSSIKRIAPSKNRISNRNSNSNIESNNCNPIPIPINDNSCEKIISEIVARDIQNFRSKPVVR